MKHNIEFKHFEPQEHVRKLIEELISRLEKHLKDFNQDVVFFRLLVEENPVRTLYHVSVTLDVPGKTIAAKEERHDVRDRRQRPQAPAPVEPVPVGPRAPVDRGRLGEDGRLSRH